MSLKSIFCSLTASSQDPQSSDSDR